MIRVRMAKLFLFCGWVEREPGGPEGTDTSAISPQYGRVCAPEVGKTHTAFTVNPLIQMTRVAVEI